MLPSIPLQGPPEAGGQSRPPLALSQFSDLELGLIRRAGTLTRIRRRQRLAPTLDGGPALYLVQNGALFVDLEIADGRRQILLLLLAGDCFDPHLLSRWENCRVMSTGPAELIRLASKDLLSLADEAPSLAQRLHSAMLDLLGPALLSRAIVGRLNGEERVASYLIEIGVRTGSLAARAAAMDMPLSRKDVADYLALNADTLSRIMTRLRARGVLGRSSRGKLAVKNWQALQALSPITATLAGA